MANYSIAVRTNYFHVRSEEEFMQLMARVIVDNGDIELLLNMDAQGLPTFGFASHGLIVGISESAEEGDEPDASEDMYEEFILALEEVVDPEDAIIILEVGSNDDNDISATATIVTSDDTDYIDLKEIASDRAVDLLAGLGSINRR